mmetsp:Transcript_52587/g.118442  ORF Transcript_52587/g.118442 Transcript_52587/m.118442 type:complete len:163 (-) Transcript_52587:150-638(-)|eukprot:CAMPEP_0197894138 /NCGR_PEP_ID=MMETSP1439-20131203/34495_1 /TAXON_ID=66791 /ORGANISM="Gonyaulax spinifera, Strain CCMP409" /LENGTH=162 /DNA_ID=CAMNT_0043514455 /DNA_START=76 /DNA_END=564 /DNA_ORIENTATION=-
MTATEFLVHCCSDVPASPTQALSSECPWCGGQGVDIITGELCGGCAEGNPEPKASRRRNRNRSSSGKVSLRSFLASAAPSQRRQRERPMQLVDIDAPDHDVSTPSSASRERSVKVRFDLDGVLEFPITPYAEIYGMHPKFLQWEDEGESGFPSDSSTEEEEV